MTFEQGYLEQAAAALAREVSSGNVSSCSDRQ